MFARRTVHDNASESFQPCSAHFSMSSEWKELECFNMFPSRLHARDLTEASPCVSIDSNNW